MSLLINLRHLEKKNLLLTGELPATSLDLDGVDELIHIQAPLRYDLEIEKFEGSILAQGSLELTLNCECVRCLAPFSFQLALNDWTSHLPLEGEEKVAIVNDCVDLTPQIREDILLAFPQHPVCDAKCSGLARVNSGRRITGGQNRTDSDSSAWAALDKLKL